MAAYGWNGVTGVATIPIAGTDSNAFAIPRGARSLTMHIPALEGVTTLKLQSLVPGSEHSTESWQDLKVWDPPNGAFRALAAFPASTDVVLQATVFGAGVLRFVASGAQTSAARVVRVFFGF